MDPEQTFIRVQERCVQMLTPRIRATMEYLYLFIAITLLSILVVMHANYVQQPGCSSELSRVNISEVQLIQIKITSAGLWSQIETEHDLVNRPEKETSSENLKPVNEDCSLVVVAKPWLNWLSDGSRSGNSPLSPSSEFFESPPQGSMSSVSIGDDVVPKTNQDRSRARFFISPKESLKAAIMRIGQRWHGRFSFIWRVSKHVIGPLWDIAGIHLKIDIPRLLKTLYLDRLNSYSVQWLEKKSEVFEPTYFFTMDKGYLLLPEEARVRHNIHTKNVSISARHSCFGNRWQQLLINRVVGYDTILMNSLLYSPGQGYLYNHQTKEFYNLTYAHEQPGNSPSFGDYLVTKCGVLMMSLFVFFTTTMSVSFTLRETQTRMLKFTVQLQHHAQHRLPTFQLIFVHVIESLVFVPIMIGILFFLFEFYDDHLLAFMILILVWLCELFTLISVRTQISMKYFPRFFLLYFLVFHIYFFSYTYGFSYLSLSTTAAFMQHLIIYFWNRFEVPALLRFMQNRRSHFQQHPDFHMTSSTILASTLQITRLNARNPAPTNADMFSGTGPSDPSLPRNGTTVISGVPVRPRNGNPGGLGNPIQFGGLAIPRRTAAVANHGTVNSFSTFLGTLGGASSEGLNSFISLFRNVRDEELLVGSPRQDNRATQNAQ